MPVTSERYRHIVFPPPAVRSPLNLGGPRSTGIAKLAAHEPAAPIPDIIAAVDEEEDAFCSWLFARAGLSARHYRPQALRRRLPACLRSLRASGIPQARRALQNNPALFAVAIDALLIGVTGFFRDARIFATLFKNLAGVLPRAERPLRIWSAACSDGMELYSIAMMLDEINALHDCELLGTDCRPDAIWRAGEGVFAAESLMRIPDGLLNRHFSNHAAEGNGLRQISSRLRKAVEWKTADLFSAIEPGPWDVILCRNMTMYLQPLSAQRLWREMTQSLVPGGLFVSGKAERPMGPGVAVTPLAPCVYQRSILQ